MEMKKNYINTKEFIEVQHKGGNKKTRHALYKTDSGSYFYFFKDKNNMKTKRYVSMNSKKGGSQPKDDGEDYEEEYLTIRDMRSNTAIISTISAKLTNKSLGREQLLCIENKIDKIVVGICTQKNKPEHNKPESNKPEHNNKPPWYNEFLIPDNFVESDLNEYGLTPEDMVILKRYYSWDLDNNQERRADIVRGYIKDKEKKEQEKNRSKKRNSEGNRKNKGGSK